MSLSTESKPRVGKIFAILIATIAIAGGLYLLALISAPALTPAFKKPIDTKSLAEPTINNDRIVIPKISVDIPYSDNETSLDTGSWWRYPERGNPEKGGNFILSAHRFTLWSTVQQTIRKSPFYNIDRLKIGDQIIIDYRGKRYEYVVDNIFDVKPTQTEIEAPSDNPKLTLYTCTLGGSADGRVVLTATPKG